MYTESNLSQQIGRGSTHKTVYAINGEPDYCFISVEKKDKGKLQRELRYYSLLAKHNVRVPEVGEIQDIIIGKKEYVGLKMEFLKGIEYKQTLSWTYIKKQIKDWDDKKLNVLLRSINNFLSSKINVTDLQVFILNETGEMVVFDPSTANIEQDVPSYPELTDIKSKIESLLKNK